MVVSMRPPMISPAPLERVLDGTRATATRSTRTDRGSNELLGHESQPNRKQLSLCYCVALALEDLLRNARPNLILRQTGADIPVEVRPALDIAEVELFREGCLHHRAGMQFVLVLMVQTPTGERREIPVRLDSIARIHARGREGVIVPAAGGLVRRLEIELIDDQKSPLDEQGSQVAQRISEWMEMVESRHHDDRVERSLGAEVEKICFDPLHLSDPQLRQDLSIQSRYLKAIRRKPPSQVSLPTADLEDPFFA